MINTNIIYHRDCLEGLRKLPDECIQACVTSPPYFNLRDYGVEGQIGNEPSPEEYVERLKAVFNEVLRVLKKDGVLWLNLGDSYWGSGKATANPEYQLRHVEFGKVSGKNISRFGRPTKGRHAHLKDRDLIGIPWMVAFALRGQGWYLRQDVIWHKPNPMPESVKNRCTKAHEYVFLLTKNKKYYFDNEAIKTLAKGLNAHDRTTRRSVKGSKDPMVNKIEKPGGGPYLKSNRRSVWSIKNKPLKAAHSAAFPPEIPELCILAGSRPRDIILDPFMGAGTTALVAKRLGRYFVGFELNPDYIRIAEERLANDPVLISRAMKEN